MWVPFNPNPCRAEEADCVVRAISAATGLEWDEVHLELCEMSRERCTMPSVNWLWGLWLVEHGFEPVRVSAFPNCTVREFCRKHPDGIYVIGTGTHAVAAIGGDWLDTSDSGDETVNYAFKRGK